MEKKLSACFLGIPIVLCMVLVFLLMNQSYEKGEKKEAYSIFLTEDAIHFDGMVDHVVKFSEIKSAEYREDFFDGKKSGAGEANSTFLAGDAKTKEFGKCKAYVYYDKPYYIVMDTKDDIFIYNLPNKEECENIYKQLQKNIKESR